MKLYTLSAALSVAASASVQVEERQAGGFARFSEPWYPTPRGGTLGNWKAAYDKAAKLVRQMTLLEKVNVTTGVGWQGQRCIGNNGGPIDRLGIPSLCMEDGPLGLRFLDLVTAFPAAITAGGTWDVDLMYRRGRAMGEETRGKGVNIILGPAMGPVGRMPAGGRNWEGFGSDPYLQGKGASHVIEGIQSTGAMACAKHFVGNEQEHFRQGRYALSENIDDRTLHELYAWPFAESVKVGVGSVMTSYNRVNNSMASQNAKLINGILKDEFGFQGFAMTDWQAQIGGVSSVLAGSDMAMPGDGLDWANGQSLWGPELTKAVLNSSVPMERLDDMVTRILASWYQLGQDRGYPKPNFSAWYKNTTGPVFYAAGEGPQAVMNEHVNVQANHKEIARTVARDGAALLKNSENTLPIKTRRGLKIGVYGIDACPTYGGPNNFPDRGGNNGTLAMPWGSGTAEFPYLVDPLEAINAEARKTGAIVTSECNENKTAEIAASAQKQDICLAFGNADAGEGFLTVDGNAGDRNDLELQRGGAVIPLVAKNCKKTVVVIHSVGPVIMESFADHKNVKSILWAHIPGQESGNALADVLFGRVSPSGKLPYTIGKKLDDWGPGGKVIYDRPTETTIVQQDFTEGLYIDYRHFDKYNIEPRYEFGFGLSYTTFSLSSLNIRKVGNTSPLPGPLPSKLAPPTYSSKLPPVSSAVYPPGFHKLPHYIYPYIDSTSNVTVGKYPYPEGYSAKPHKSSAAGGGQGGHPDLWKDAYEVSVRVKNTGKVYGAEVVQVYLGMNGMRTYGGRGGYSGGNLDAPKRVLRAFSKVWLQPGESKTVTLKLQRRDVSYWDVVQQNWVIPSGRMNVDVGTSSRNIKLRGNINS